VSKRRLAPSLFAMWSGAACLFLFVPSKVWALPQFARAYNLKCTACHTIVPVLNEQGALFQSLGYHLPPALKGGEAEAAPRLSDLGKNAPEWVRFLAPHESLAVVGRPVPDLRRPKTAAPRQCWPLLLNG
jgi:hypothetical protein